MNRQISEFPVISGKSTAYNIPPIHCCPQTVNQVLIENVIDGVLNFWPSNVTYNNGDFTEVLAELQYISAGVSTLNSNIYAVYNEVQSGFSSTNSSISGLDADVLNGFSSMTASINLAVSSINNNTNVATNNTTNTILDGIGDLVINSIHGGLSALSDQISVVNANVLAGDIAINSNISGLATHIDGNDAALSTQIAGVDSDVLAGNALLNDATNGLAAINTNVSGLAAGLTTANAGIATIISDIPGLAKTSDVTLAMNNINTNTNNGVAGINSTLTAGFDHAAKNLQIISDCIGGCNPLQFPNGYSLI
jgi:hypothetical protein